MQNPAAQSVQPIGLILDVVARSWRFYNQWMTY